MSLDQVMNEMDIPNLLDYHRRLMQARDETVGSSAPKRKSSAIEESDFPYQIDGVVYKLSSFTSRQVCGSSSRIPRWAIAHKFHPVTRLVDIEVQIGRTGALTPVLYWSLWTLEVSWFLEQACITFILRGRCCYLKV